MVSKYLYVCLSSVAVEFLIFLMSSESLEGFQGFGLGPLLSAAEEFLLCIVLFPPKPLSNPTVSFPYVVLECAARIWIVFLCVINS